MFCCGCDNSPILEPPQLAHYTSPEITELEFSTVIKNRCELPKDAGICGYALVLTVNFQSNGVYYRENISMYYYNFVSKQCELFSYGGCMGNENKFSTLTECEENCGRKARQQVSFILIINCNFFDDNLSINVTKEIFSNCTHVKKFVEKINFAFKIERCAGNSFL